MNGKNSVNMADLKSDADGPRRGTEPRWPAILALLYVFGLVTSLPSRYQPAPPWFPWTAFGIAVASMLAVTFAPTNILWHRVERMIVLVLFAVVCALNILSVGRLVADMITHKHGYGSITLLESATVIWTLNILLFALLYWQVDRAGPAARTTGASGAADFHFAEADDAETSLAWEPRFVDYLFLAFVTSTSFTPPDYARPSSHRAKAMLMVQASVSLTTLFLIASRAISTLS
jgi:hypothetical protein